MVFKWYSILQKVHLVRIYGNKSKIRNKHNFNHFWQIFVIFRQFWWNVRSHKYLWRSNTKKCFQNLNPKSKFSLILNIFGEDQKPILRVSSRSVAVDDAV